MVVVMCLNFDHIAIVSYDLRPLCLLKDIWLDVAIAIDVIFLI